MTAKMICPTCRLSDRVEKASTIYLEGMRTRQPAASRQMEGNSEPSAIHNLTDLSPKDLSVLSGKLTPPSSGKSGPTRPVHPDIIVIVFSCVIPIFLMGILNQQRGLFLPVLVIVACLYGLYIFKRKTIISRFKLTLDAKRAEQKRVEQAIKTWMKLYYCARDEGVFLPGNSDLIPIDQMPSYLLGPDSSAFQS
jgi:hypothetical protein